MTITVALVHDYLKTYGEAEQVLEALHQIYPDAPVYTAFIDQTSLGADFERFRGWDLRPTFAQRLPGITRHYQRYRPWLPYVWESLDLSAYELVISSSGNYLSKSVLTRPETLHLCYCHTPPHYLWEKTPPQSGFWPTRWYRTRVDLKLRQYDFYAAQRVDRYITNSQRTARRIHKFYRRQAEVIPPPVVVQGEGRAGKDYYLYRGRLEPSQRVDWVISACQQLDRPLWIVGEGSLKPTLQQMAGPGTRFLSSVSASEKADLYAHARALICPQPNADFVGEAVEAMGYGVPVIAAASSGLREAVLEYRTGLLFPENTATSLEKTIAQFEGLRFSSLACIERAREFDRPVFAAKLEWLIAQALDEHRLQGAIHKVKDEEAA